jgi:nesprin-1
MVHNKELGMAKFNNAIESGEKMYPTTAADGREIIRQELRNLRDNWETFADDLNETQRDLETQLMQWTSYDDSFDMLAKWLDDMEHNQLTLVEAKDMLPEKKSMLQHYRVFDLSVVLLTLTLTLFLCLNPRHVHITFLCTNTF